ncbi:MAG: MarR family transcriptional regulator [Verrucomicrobiota bacterium]
MSKAGQNALRIRELIAETESTFAATERQLLHSINLCHSDIAILRRLRRKGPRPVNTLAPRIGLTSGSMTTAVQRLLKRNLVSTRRDLADRRVVWVEITSNGEELLLDLQTKRNNCLAPLADDFTDRELKLLSGLLKKLRRSGRAESLQRP